MWFSSCINQATTISPSIQYNCYKVFCLFSKYLTLMIFSVCMIPCIIRQLFKWLIKGGGRGRGGRGNLCNSYGKRDCLETAVNLTIFLVFKRLILLMVQCFSLKLSTYRTSCLRFIWKRPKTSLLLWFPVGSLPSRGQIIFMILPYTDPLLVQYNMSQSSPDLKYVFQWMRFVNSWGNHLKNTGILWSVFFDT